MRTFPEGSRQQGRSGNSGRETTDLLCSYDLRGNIIEISEGLERLTGYTRQEVRGMNLSDLLDASSVQTARLKILDHAGGAATHTQRVIARAKDGRSITLDLVTRLVFERGNPVAVQGFAKHAGADREELRQAEARLSTSSSELAQFTGHLKQLHRLSTTNYRSLDEVFADYLKTGCELFCLDTGIVCQVDGDSAAIVAAQGGSTALHQGARLRLQETHWSSVADRLRTQTSSPASEDRKVHPELAICLATPILVEAELYGTLSFSSESGGVRIFTSEEQELVELMGRSIGRSILEDRIRSERKSGDNLERDRNRVLETMAENRPLSITLTHLANMLEAQSPGAACAVLVPREGALICEAAPGLSSEYRSAIDQLGMPAPGQVSYGESLALEAITPVAERFGLGTHSTSPIYSATGLLLGAIIVHFREESRCVVNPEVMRMACRLAGIAIEQRQLTDRLEFQAQHDSLTGLPNRFHLLELLTKRLDAAASAAGTLAVLFIDLDRFKQINDTLGHLVGDRILVEVAQRLKRGLPYPEDVAGRMGGDEFTVILSHPPDHKFAFRVGRQFLQRLRAPYLIDDHELFVTASIGISFYPQDGIDAATLLQKADQAMYGAKNSGKNDLESFVKGTGSGAIQRLELENALRRALEKGELDLNFQPIVTIDGELDGLEVLLAWNHPRFGRISPKQFIPIAEETGLIVSIGSWVVRAACTQGARWLAGGLKPGRIGVNVSAIQFSRQDFVETVAYALAASEFPANLLDLELTESCVIQEIDKPASQLSRLRELGVRISIDDFGTGYSSLSYLRQLPVDTLKIDQSFLRDLQAPSGSLPVVQTIVSLAHNMNLTVVAEGVETTEDLELLRAAGCDKVQGHLYGESLSRSEMELLLSHTDRKVCPVRRADAVRPDA